MKKMIKPLCAAAALAVLVTTGSADTVDQTLNSQMMYGITKSTGVLSKYDFAHSHGNSIATVKEKASNATITDIRAAVYFPGAMNIYALWQSPSDNKNKLVYVDVTTGVGTIVAGDVEGGKFTGAAALHPDTVTYKMFAVQQAKVKPPSTISGLVNINPNNSPQNEFSCTKDSGVTFTRDDLAANNVQLDGNGTYYQGAATAVHVKPKGNGSQAITLDGVNYDLQNSNTYDFTGAMTVRVYNDKVNGNGKAMGKWWIQIINGQVVVNNQVTVLSPNRIATVDFKNGTVNEIMSLSRAYHGLATVDGVVFYSTADNNDLYKIDTTAGTETKLGAVQLSSLSAMQFVGGYLMAYDINNTALAPISPATAQNVATPANLGMNDDGVIMFFPSSTEVKEQFPAAD